jgi:glucose-6-phosphate isomerase
MSQYLIIRERLQAELGEGYRRHLLFTTDPEKGVLRALAKEEDVATLPVPGNVGGRFSVLSAVGLLPAALVGIDIRELLAGAQEMVERCAAPELRKNPAGVFAALQYLADTELDANVHVMMPYSDRLRDVADWFRQLWAESLGKQRTREGGEVFAGPTPVKALGATDQHSQVQLYVEGPFDKTITFLAEHDGGEDVQIPHAYPRHAELAYLGGHSMGELLRTEMLATEAALAQRGRMNMTIEVPRVDARSLGGLFMLLQIATVYAGHLYGIDPMDQPGVELGKQLTYGIMGRPGFEEARGEWEGRTPKDDAFVLR